MSKKSSYSGAVLRMQRDARVAEQLDPKQEATRREASFLRGMANATDDLNWLLANDAWALLGFETFTAWWDDRIVPVADGLGMRPTAEVARLVAERLLEDQKALPRPQRLTQKEIADKLGISGKTLQRRSQDRSQRTMSSGADLGNGAKPPLVDAIRGEIEDVQHNQETAATGTTPAADGVSGTEASVSDTLDGEADRPGPAVIPEDSPASRDPNLVPEDLAVATPGQPEEDPSVRSGQEKGTDEEGASAEASYPPAVTGVSAVGGETGMEAPSPRAPSAPVAGREQQDPAGVEGLAAPGPVELLEELAEKFQGFEVDEMAPLMTAAEVDAMRAALLNLATTVGLFLTWHERAQP